MAAATVNSSAEQSPAMQSIPNSEKFFRYFQHESAALRDQLERLAAHAAGPDRVDAITHAQASIARLSDSVKDAAAIIPAHDQRTYGDTIKALTNRLQEIKAAVAPRPKFQFKSGLTLGSVKKNASAISLNDAAELASQKRRAAPGYPSSSNESSAVGTPAYLRSPPPEPNTSEPASTADGAGEVPPSSDTANGAQQPSVKDGAVRVADQSNVRISLPPATDSVNPSVALSDLRRCVVDLSSTTASGAPFANMMIKDISDSLVITGRISGSVHLTKITHSVLVVTSQQFRMHDSTDCTVYLLTPSRPIIEGCSGIRFAPLPDPYLAAVNEAAQVKNWWDQVDDFKWLRNEPSPNWSVLGPEARVGDQVWRDFVSGDKDANVDEVLKAVGAGRA